MNLLNVVKRAGKACGVKRDWGGGEDGVPRGNEEREKKGRLCGLYYSDQVFGHASHRFFFDPGFFFSLDFSDF